MQHFLKTMGVGLLIIVLFLLAVLGGMTIINLGASSEPESDSDWYLVCSGKDKDYLVKSEGKPYTKDGFIYVDGDSFITAEAGMTCKPVTGEVVRAAIGQKGLEQGK